MFTLLIQKLFGQLLIFCLVCSLQFQRFISDVQSFQLQLQLLGGGAASFLPLSDIWNKTATTQSEYN